MKSILIVAASIAFIGVSTPRASADTAAAPADLMQQVQAADLLADLITYSVDRADTRLKDAQAYLQSIGKAQAYEQAPSDSSHSQMPRPLNYMLLFRGSLAFVEQDGAHDGDPYAEQSVKDEPISQLYQDLTAAQYYNMHEFLHFNQQRQTFASIQAYLKSIGEYDKFLALTEGKQGTENAPANRSSTQPTPTTPQEVATRMGDLIQFIHETAWKEAQAKGTSRADFDKQWPARLKQYRESVMAKIEGSEPQGGASGAGGFGQTEIAGTPLPPTSAPSQTAGITPPQVIYAAPPTDLGANRQLPPPVYSPYTNGLYRSRDRSLWDMWDFNRRY